jgi:hypothetical protein
MDPPAISAAAAAVSTAAAAVALVTCAHAYACSCELQPEPEQAVAPSSAAGSSQHPLVHGRCQHGTASGSRRLAGASIGTALADARGIVQCTSQKGKAQAFAARAFLSVVGAGVCMRVRGACTTLAKLTAAACTDVHEPQQHGVLRDCMPQGFLDELFPRMKAAFRPRERVPLSPERAITAIVVGTPDLRVLRLTGCAWTCMSEQILSNIRTRTHISRGKMPRSLGLVARRRKWIGRYS